MLVHQRVKSFHGLRDMPICALTAVRSRLHRKHRKVQCRSSGCRICARICEVFPFNETRAWGYLGIPICACALSLQCEWHLHCVIKSWGQILLDWHMKIQTTNDVSLFVKIWSAYAGHKSFVWTETGILMYFAYTISSALVWNGSLNTYSNGWSGCVFSIFKELQGRKSCIHWKMAASLQDQYIYLQNITKQYPT